jgi:hypothetical protein
MRRLLSIVGAVLAFLLVTQMSAIERVYAQESDSFSVEEDVGNEAGDGEVSSDSYQMEDVSVSWEEPDAESESFQEGSGGDDEDSSGGGGSGGGSSGSGGGGSSDSGETSSSSSGGGSRGGEFATPGEQTEQEVSPTPATPSRPAAPSRAIDPFPDLSFSPESFLPSFRLTSDQDVQQFGKSQHLLRHEFGVTDSPWRSPWGSMHEYMPFAHKMVMYSSDNATHVLLFATNVLLFVSLIAIGAGIASGRIVIVTKKPKRVRRLKRKGHHLKTHRGKVAHMRKIGVAVLLVAAFTLFLRGNPAEAKDSVPAYISYNGTLRNSAGVAITTKHVFRFSFWSTVDAVPADLLPGKVIDTSAAGYAGWQEVQGVTPKTNGNFSVKLGSGSAIREFKEMSEYELQNLHLQVEVKPDGAPDTAYEILDVSPQNPAVDRSAIRSVPFALNADLVDQRGVGTGSGQIAVLGPGGVFGSAQMGGGTNSGTFIIDKDNTEGSAVTLQFGQNLGKKLSYNQASTYFNFNDDVNIQGNLTVTGLINGIDITTISSDNDSHLKASSGAGLTVNIAGGDYRLGGDVTQFTGTSSIAVANNTTNYVFFTGTGMQVTNAGFPTNKMFIPVATVETAGGNIVSVDDRRVFNSDDRERTVELFFHPEYPNVSYQGDATSNVGQMTVSHDGINKNNYYQWTSTRLDLQDYNVIVRVTLSSDFVRWAPAPLSVAYRSASGNVAENKMDISVLDTNGSPVSLSGAATGLVSTTWNTTNLTYGGTPTWNPGQDMLLSFKMSAKDAKQMHLGKLTLRYVTLLSE